MVSVLLILQLSQLRRNLLGIPQFMFIRLIIVLYLIFVSANAWAVDATIKPLLDDLNRALKAKQENIQTPLTRIMSAEGLTQDNYLDLQRKSMASLFRFYRVDEMKQLNEQVYLARLQQGLANYEVYYWVYQSNIAKREDNLVKMLTHAEQALEIALNKEVNSVLGVAYLTAGDAHFSQENFSQAIEYLTLAIEYAPNQASKVAYSSRLSDVYQQTGEYLKAIELQTAAIKKLQELGETARVADAYYSLANIYLLMQDHQQAVVYFSESKNRDLALQSDSNAAYSAIKLCESYIALTQFEKAKVECEFGRNVFSNKKALANIAWADLALSSLYRGTEQYQKSESVMLLTLTEFSNFLSPSKVSQIHLELAQSQLALNKLNMAAENIETAINELPNDKTPTLADAYLVASKIYEKLEQYQLANDFLKKHVELQQKILVASHDKTVSRLRNDIEHIRKQQLINQLQIEKSQQQEELGWHLRNIKIGVLVIPITILLVFWAFRLQQQKNRLLSQEKALSDSIMEKKNQLLADVSHELGTPITVLKLQIEALQDGLEKDLNQAYDGLADKLSDVERLIRDIHQLAQFDIGANVLQLERVQALPHLLKWQLEIEKLVRHHDFTFSFEHNVSEDIEVNIDLARINQVLSNVVCNSIKYTDKPGSIKVSAYVDNTNVFVTVEDSSPSVSNAELTKIFERLYRVDSSRSRQSGGSGLGLAICRSIIKAHQGEIVAEASPLGGLKILISIPIKVEG